MPTLWELARVWFKRKKRGLSNGKHVRQNWQMLQDFIFSDLGNRRLDQIRQRDIVRTLDPVWRDKRETARRPFDADRMVWVTSQERMKMRRAHRVPLVQQTRIILDNLELIRAEGTEHVFGKPRSKSGVISENAALNLSKKFDPNITMHGFRSSFRTWARKKGCYEYDAMEIALAHEKDDLVAAYERDDLLEERQPLMADWADFVTGGEGPVSLLAPLAGRVGR